MLRIRTRDDSLQTILHRTCEDYEYPVVHGPEQNQSRVLIDTSTVTANTLFSFDQDDGGYEHLTPLAQIPSNLQADVALAMVRKPLREISPVINNDGLLGLYGARSDLHNASEAEVVKVILNDMGRIAITTDDLLPKINSMLIHADE